MIGIVYCTQRKERENAINNMSLESEAESVRCAGASIILYCFARKTIICNFHLHAKVKPVPTWANFIYSMHWSDIRITRI